MTTLLAMQGRGMFYGESDPWGHRRVFSPAQWDAVCRQAAQDWGMQWVHPKVADGAYWWYDHDPNNKTGTSLAMLTIIAHHHGLKIAPYHYCYGDKFGGLANEAMIASVIALTCDACCPDMEIEWNGHADWAVRFGSIVRQHAPHGLFYPTLFGDPGYFPSQPYLEWERWIDGWMPMVYFALWTDRAGHQDTAAEARDFVFPQWLALDQRVKAAGTPPKPILPLVEVGSHLPPQEIANWLHLMGGYGYCGFWYDGPYGPYAQAVKSQPVPVLAGQSPVVPPHVPPTPPPPPPRPAPPTPPKPPVPYSAPDLVGPGLTSEKGESTMNQNMTVQELQALWDMNGKVASFNLQHGIPAVWAIAMQKHPDTLAHYLGAPLHEESGAVIDGQPITFIDFTGGGRLVWFRNTNKVVFTMTPRSPTRAGTLSAGEEVVPPSSSAPAPAPIITTPLPAVLGSVSQQETIMVPVPPVAAASVGGGSVS